MTHLSGVLYSNLLLDLLPHVSAYVFDEYIIKGKVEYFPGASVTDVACMQLATTILKKNQDLLGAEADAAALVKFTAANNSCRDWVLRLDTTREEVLYHEFRQVVWEFLNPGGYSLIPGCLVSLLRESDLVGPGSSIGAAGEDFYTKLFAGNLSTTRSCLVLAYESYLKELPHFWLDAEKFRADRFGAPKVVAGNRLSFVPKTYDCSRSICTEPSLNMMFQKGIGNILERRLRQYFGIDLKSQQSKNRDLAQVGSLDGSMVTIDLSSASDTIANRMLEQVLQKDFYSLLQLVRSPVTTISGAESAELHMVSTMGNGFTFPLQTMLFAAVVQASARFRYSRSPRDGGSEYSASFVLPRREKLGTFGVNGDDIVCRRELAGDVLSLLNILGFQVNASKSFVEGPFRESCGGDFFHGSPVRGVYNESLADPQSRYSTINRLNWWSARHKIPLRNSIQCLLRTVRFLPIPPWEDEAAGIKVPLSMVSGLRRDRNLQSILYRRMVHVPVKVRIMDASIEVPRSVRGRVYNPSGLLASFLLGAVKGSGRKSKATGTFNVRHDEQRFRAEVGVAPNWGCTSTVQPFGSPEEERCWASTVWLNVSHDTEG